MNTKLTKIEKKDDKNSSRAFGFLFAAVFLIIGLILTIQGSPTIRYWPFIIASLFFVLSVIYPASMKFPKKVWIGIGNILHYVTSPMVLALIFYLVITPIGLIMRLSRLNNIDKKFDINSQTYWIERSPRGPSPESMLNQF
ncbi:SxtJ family membrane protein [Polynucleobacter sp. HIN9]|uniref:SxtJ family membrane protein n=1 Tax=Polynucleobacter sp. HIN9 TaxID=3047868 RepID=UPI00336579C0